MPIVLLSPLMVGSFCQVWVMDEGEDSNAGGKRDLY